MSSITPTPTQLKALTHPARVRMLGLLRVEGPATATALATRLGINTGATSYHLRQLATHGFIVDDHSRGNGRERWWKAAHQATVTDSTVVQDPASDDAYLQVVVSTYVEQLQRALEERPVLPAEWRSASTFSDWILTLSPARAAAAVAALAEVMSALEDEDDPAATPFVLQLNAYPFPGRLGEDPQ